MNIYSITYYAGRTMQTLITADNMEEAKETAKEEMKSVLHLILEGKYKVDRYTKSTTV